MQSNAVDLNGATLSASITQSGSNNIASQMQNVQADQVQVGGVSVSASVFQEGSTKSRTRRRWAMT